MIYGRYPEFWMARNAAKDLTGPVLYDFPAFDGSPVWLRHDALVWDDADGMFTVEIRR